MAGLISTTYVDPQKKQGVQNMVGDPNSTPTLQKLPNANPNTAPTIQPLSTGAATAVNNIAAQAAPNAIQMNYTDPSGNNAVGYSINNRMYKDAAGTQRIDEGSIVTNQAGTQAWIMQNGAGVPIANYQPGANAAITNAYGSAVRAANQRMEANIAQIEANRPKINDAYNQLQQQNYQGYMQSQKALANQLASQGLYNSGYSDTAKVAQNVGYRSAQSETERARLQALADLETEINVARLNGSANLAELEAEYAILQNEQANYEREFAYNAAQDLMDREYRRDRDAVEDQRYEDQVARDEAWKRAEIGDFSGLEAMGIDTTEARAALARGVREEDVSYAITLASLGDYSGLEALGIDSTTYREANERAAFNEKLATAIELAQMGDFSKLIELGIDPAYYEQIMNNELALSNNSVKQSNLAIEAAYQDLALGNQQKELNAKKLSETETDASKADETDYDALYNKNPKLFEDIMALAKTWVTNNANSSQSVFDEQYESAYNVALKTYGQDYADLWAATVSQEWSAMMHPETEPFDRDGFVNSWKERIYSESTTTTTTGDENNSTTTKTTGKDVNVDVQKRAIKDLYFYAQAYNMSDTEFYAIAKDLGVDVGTVNLWLEEIDEGKW